jgi:uncharacterized protein (DUF305 family)
MCKILAVRLDHLAFKDWIDQELNGYENREYLPDYRVLKGLGSRGDFFDPFGGSLSNAPIPLLSLPGWFREDISKKYVQQSVSAIESIVNQANQDNMATLRCLWNADAVAVLGQNIYEGMVCGQAWFDIPTYAFITILHTVKSRTLDFVLAIEAEAPDAGEAQPGEKPLPEGVINFFFDRCILHQNNQTAFSEAVIQTHNQATHMSENYVNHLQRANIANMANTVKDNARQQANQYIHLSKEKKTLAEAANEIQQLLKQLEQNNPTATEAEKVAYINDETTPSFKRRVVSAMQAGGEAAIEEFLDNSYVNIGKAIIKGWVKPE